MADEIHKEHGQKNEPPHKESGPKEETDFNGSNGDLTGNGAGRQQLSNGGAASGTSSVSTDPATVREFLGIINAHAARLAAPIIAEDRDPGRLQLVFILPGSVHHRQYAIGDVDGMARDAAQYAVEGWNVYIEGRTVRSDVRVGRGCIEDTVFVFALCADLDPDKGRAARLDCLASLVVESSPGNRHLWLFFDRAMGAAAVDLGRRLRVFAHDVDACTGCITTPFRVAGTPNFPDPEKQIRGRKVCGTRILEHSGKLWSVAEMEEAFPPIPEQEVLDHGAIDDAGLHQIAGALSAIPNNPPVRHDVWRDIFFAGKWAADNAETPEIAERIREACFAWSDSARGCVGSKPDYGNRQRDRIWKNAKSNRNGQKVTKIGTLFHHAFQYGWTFDDSELMEALNAIQSPAAINLFDRWIEENYGREGSEASSLPVMSSEADTPPRSAGAAPAAASTIAASERATPRAEKKADNVEPSKPSPKIKLDYRHRDTRDGKQPPYKFKFIPFEEIIFNQSEEWLVKKILPRRGVAALYGASGSFKSFVLLDLALHVALGWPWAGRRVKQANVIYIAAEGAGGFPKRKAGWLKNKSDLSEKVPFSLVSAAPNLGGAKGDLEALTNAVERAGVKPGVICIDTLAQSLGGAEENGSGMVQFVANATALANHFGALVIIVHHVGLADDQRLRGHSSLIAALDAAALSERNEGAMSTTH